MKGASKLILAIGLTWTMLTLADPPEQFFSTDPYTILGIARSADIEEIRRAHRKHGKQNQFEGDKEISEETRIERIWIMKRVNMAVSALRAGEPYVTPPDKLPNGDPIPVKPGSSEGGGHGRRAAADSAASHARGPFAKYAAALQATKDPQELKALWDACLAKEGPMAFFEIRDSFALRFVELLREARNDSERAKVFYFYGISNLELPGLASGLDAMLEALPEGPLRNQLRFIDRVRARDRLVSAGTDRSLLYAYAAAADQVHASGGTKSTSADRAAAADKAWTSLVVRTHEPNETRPFDWKSAFESVEATTQLYREQPLLEPFHTVIGNAWARDPATFQAEIGKARTGVADGLDTLLRKRRMLGWAIAIPTAAIAAACIGPCLLNMNAYSQPELLMRAFPGMISGLASYLAWKEMTGPLDSMVRGSTLLGNYSARANEVTEADKRWSLMGEAMKDLHPWAEPRSSSAYAYSPRGRYCNSMFAGFGRELYRHIVRP